MEQDTNWLPDFLQGKNAKVVLWIFVGVIVILLIAWAVVSISRSGNDDKNDVPVVLEPANPMGGGSNTNPTPSPSQWNNPQKIQEDAKTIAWYIFNHLKEGWSSSWVCLSNRKISTAVAAMVGSTDNFLKLVGSEYRNLDPQMSPKISELLEKTSCSIGSNKKLVVGRLKTLGL